MECICCNSSLFNNRKWIVDFGANHQMIKNDFRLDNVVDVSKLNLRVDHPYGSSTK